MSFALFCILSLIKLLDCTLEAIPSLCVQYQACSYAHSHQEVVHATLTLQASLRCPVTVQKMPCGSPPRKGRKSPHGRTCVLQAGRDNDEGDAGGAARAAGGGEGEPAGGEERGPPLELFGADNPDRTDAPGGPDFRGPPSEREEGDPEGPLDSDWDEEDPQEALEGGADALEALGEGGEGDGEEDDEDGLYASEVRSALRRAGHLALLHYWEARLENKQRHRLGSA